MIGEYDCYHVCEWVVSALEKHGVLEDRYSTHDESGKVWTIKHDELLDILKHCDIVPPKEDKLVSLGLLSDLKDDTQDDYLLTMGEEKDLMREGWRDR